MYPIVVPDVFTIGDHVFAEFDPGLFVDVNVAVAVPMLLGPK